MRAFQANSYNEIRRIEAIGTKAGITMTYPDLGLR
jgi:hypothetical protein